MKKIDTLKLSTLILARGLTSTSAIAFNTDEVKDGQAPLAAEFSKLDVNGNDLLGRTEARKDKLFTYKNFSNADVDSDGTLDQDEYANYKSAAQKVIVKRVASDSVITSKAKAKLLAEKDLKSLQISVKTYKGEVILSGFVDDELSKVKAETIVSRIEGVQSVKNSLVVKS
jgi:hyperosmotically inducible protein